MLPGASQFTEQVISCPQHTGDLIFPWLLGHLDTWTFEPSSNFKVSLTNCALHFAQVAFTDIPHFEHSYVAIYSSFSDFLKNNTEISPLTCLMKIAITIQTRKYSP